MSINLRMVPLVVFTIILLAMCKKQDTHIPKAKDDTTNPQTLENMAPTPRKAWESFKTAVKEDDGERIWAFISDKSKQWLISGVQGERLQTLKSLPPSSLKALAEAGDSTPEQMQKMSKMELARVVMVAEAKKNKADIVASSIKTLEMKEGAAVITLSKPGGREDPLVLIYEDQVWRLDGEQTSKLKTISKIR